MRQQGEEGQKVRVSSLDFQIQLFVGDIHPAADRKGARVDGERGFIDAIGPAFQIGGDAAVKPDFLFFQEGLVVHVQV